MKALPSMNGSLKVTVYSQPDALTVPAKSVFNEGADDSQHYVYLSIDGKSARRDVKVGRRTEAHVEILEGLQEGDLVLIKKPDDE
jgi:multidrug efflux pump subunit AcrA (membrane-fusion protein)